MERKDTVMDHKYAVDLATARAVVADCRAAIEAAYAAHGLATPTISLTYGPELKLTVKGPAVAFSESGVNTLTPEAQAYERFSRMYRLNPGLLGNEITMAGKRYKFLGIATKRTKYPYLFLNMSTGKQILHTDAVVERLNATVTA